MYRCRSFLFMNLHEIVFVFLNITLKHTELFIHLSYLSYLRFYLYSFLNLYHKTLIIHIFHRLQQLFLTYLHLELPSYYHYLFLYFVSSDLLDRCQEFRLQLDLFNLRTINYQHQNLTRRLQVAEYFEY